MMKTLFLLLAFSFSVSASMAQSKVAKAPDANKEVKVVEASCGQCKFGLTGSDCDLAVRIDGKAYFVDGTAIDDHGDAHAKDGFCNSIRKAKVQGEIVDGRFKASYFQLIPEVDKTKKTNKEKSSKG